MTQLPDFLKRFDLGLDADERAIRRAYAVELKRIDQATEADRFQELRTAYEAALNWARHRHIEYDEHVDDAEENSTRATMAVAADSQTDVDASVHAAEGADAAPAAPVAIVADVEHAIETEDASAASAAVFNEFCERFYAVVAQYRTYDDKLVKPLLDDSLRDPRLDNFDARDMFEWRIADLLLAGWRRGNEVLMVVAGQTFCWIEDQRRLQRFGRTGFLLDHAFAERESFFQQSRESTESRRAAIARLRDPRRPSNSELVGMLLTLEKMRELYPYWLPLIADVEQIQRWREWHDEIPSWRQFSVGASLQKVKDTVRSVKWLTPWRAVWLIFIIVRAVTAFSHH